MRLRARLTVVAFAVVFVVGGCGGPSDGGMSSAARTQLVPLVRQVRRAADLGDVNGLQRALAELQRAVASNRSRGDISAARAATILDASALVQRRVALVPTTTTSTTTTSTTPPPAAPGHGKVNKHGKGHGDNGDGGHD